jgi:hypothetical protein
MASRNAKARLIYWKISYSEELASCTEFAALLFTWIIPNLDDLGRMEGNPEVVKGMLFPLHKRVTARRVSEALAQLQSKGLIEWYKVKGKRYIQFPGFPEYQRLRKDRVHKSDYPGPPVKPCPDTARREESEDVPEKHRFLTFSEHKNIRLTASELASLERRWGSHATRRLIGDLDDYIGSSGKDYKSHFYAINTFAKRNGVHDLGEMAEKERRKATEEAAREEERKRRADEPKLSEDEVLNLLPDRIKQKIKGGTNDKNE